MQANLERYHNKEEAETRPGTTITRTKEISLTRNGIHYESPPLSLEGIKKENPDYFVLREPG